jgi:hypothetical protein
MLYEMLAGVVSVAVMGGALLRACWVRGRPDAWTLVVRDGELVRGGVGLSGLRRPTDQVVQFPASVQRVRFEGGFVDAEGLEARLEGFALWAIDEAAPLQAYRRLGLVSGQQHHSGHLLSRAQHHAFQQAFGALVRREGGSFRYSDLCRAPKPLLLAVLQGARDQLGGLGVHVEDVQLLTLSVTQEGVLEALGAAAVQAAQQHADAARHATVVARDAQDAAALAARERAEVEAAIARAAVDAERAALAQVAAREALDAKLERERLQTDADVSQLRLRMALEAEKDPAVRAHELAMLQATAARDALKGVAEARVVHVGGGLVDWLGGRSGASLV